MKTFHLLTFILLFSLQADAQKIRFTDSTNIWQTLSRKEYPGTQNRFRYNVDKTFYKGDTTISGFVCKKMYDSEIPQHAQAYVEEDTIAKKVYARLWYDLNIRHLLYDYSLQTGDTFYSALAYNSSYKGMYYVVDKLDSIKINNTWHKRFYLKAKDKVAFPDLFDYGYQYIEGIGSNHPLDPLWGDGKLIRYRTLERRLICFKNNGKAPAIFSNCNDTLLNINTIKNNQVIKIYPQPAHSNITIELPSVINNGSIALYNPLGQTIYKGAIINKKTLHLPLLNISQGVHYYKITSNAKGERYSGSLLIE